MAGNKFVASEKDFLTLMLTSRTAPQVDFLWGPMSTLFVGHYVD
jgi:hypothetical protein